MDLGQPVLQHAGLPDRVQILPPVLRPPSELKTAGKGGHVRPPTQEILRGKGAAHKGQQKEH